MAEARGNRFLRRTSMMEFDGWRGVDLQSNPSAQPPGKLRAAENLRISLGLIDSRGGQAKANSVALTGVITSIWPGNYQLP
jgi:hypothetical protein